MERHLMKGPNVEILPPGVVWGNLEGACIDFNVEPTSAAIEASPYCVQILAQAARDAEWKRRRPPATSRCASLGAGRRCDGRPGS